METSSSSTNVELAGQSEEEQSGRQSETQSEARRKYVIAGSVGRTAMLATAFWLLFQPAVRRLSNPALQPPRVARRGTRRIRTVIAAQHPPGIRRRD